ncbi:hypothetical protein PR048_030013 [Dryococelus australis]|uniref:Uncharacterized protein n=1 Tax=Dryococelus australis TaxID=614101 RepID=A0ABQ9G7R9_9NEOP|nr:hypothetical protein PR048_030013 [Dryococelus australis]
MLRHRDGEDPLADKHNIAVKLVQDPFGCRAARGNTQIVIPVTLFDGLSGPSPPPHPFSFPLLKQSRLPPTPLLPPPQFSHSLHCRKPITTAEKWSSGSFYTRHTVPNQYGDRLRITPRSPLVNDRPVMNTVKYRVVSGVVWTNRTTRTGAGRSGPITISPPPNPPPPPAHQPYGARRAAARSRGPENVIPYRWMASPWLDCIHRCAHTPHLTPSFSWAHNCAGLSPEIDPMELGTPFLYPPPHFYRAWSPHTRFFSLAVLRLLKQLTTTSSPIRDWMILVPNRDPIRSGIEFRTTTVQTGLYGIAESVPRIPAISRGVAVRVASYEELAVSMTRVESVVLHKYLETKASMGLWEKGSISERNPLTTKAEFTVEDSRPRLGRRGNWKRNEKGGKKNNEKAENVRSRVVRLPASHTQANQVRFQVRSLLDFRTWESCRMAGFLGDLPFSPVLAFRRCSILASLHTRRVKTTMLTAAQLSQVRSTLSTPDCQSLALVGPQLKCQHIGYDGQPVMRLVATASMPGVIRTNTTLASRDIETSITCVPNLLGYPLWSPNRTVRDLETISLVGAESGEVGEGRETDDEQGMQNFDPLFVRECMHADTHNATAGWPALRRGASEHPECFTPTLLFSHSAVFVGVLNNPPVHTRDSVELHDMVTSDRLKRLSRITMRLNQRLLARLQHLTCRAPIKRGVCKELASNQNSRRKEQGFGVYLATELIREIIVPLYIRGFNDSEVGRTLYRNELQFQYQNISVICLHPGTLKELLDVESTSFVLNTRCICEAPGVCRVSWCRGGVVVRLPASNQGEPAHGGSSRVVPFSLNESVGVDKGVCGGVVERSGEGARERPARAVIDAGTPRKVGTSPSWASGGVGGSRCCTRVFAYDRSDVCFATEDTNRRLTSSVKRSRFVNIYFSNNFTVSLDRRMNKVMRLMEMLILDKAEGYTTCIQVASGFAQLGIVVDDAAGRRAFSEISRFPRPSIPALPHSHLTSPSSALKTLMLRAAQISSFTHLLAAVKNLRGTHLGFDVTCVEITSLHSNRSHSAHWLVNAFDNALRYKLTCHNYLSDYSLPTKADQVQFPAGRSRIFARINRAGQCHWSADFLGGSPVSPPFHCGATIYSPRFTLIDSQDLDSPHLPVKNAEEMHQSSGNFPTHVWEFPLPRT